MPETPLHTLKTICEIGFYLATTFGALWAVWTYRENQLLERSKWAASLYKQFFLKTGLLSMRRKLDRLPDSSEVAELVAKEDDVFTDYLNFFEHVAYLVKRKQINREDAEAYFDYYLSCLKQHPAVLAYIRDKSKGFGQLAEFLGK
jgi:hypothetical protein